MSESNPFKPTDFRYYFAVDRGDYRRFEEEFDGFDVLVSFVYLTEKKDKAGKFRDMIQGRNGNVMIDSGGFTNFTKPGTVRFEEWSEFMTDARKWADEYVMFDDLTSRPNTLRLYKKALEAGHNPLFVDHLFLQTHGDEVRRIWESDPKLAVSGFAKTLPGQRVFPGDPAKALRKAFDLGRKADTVNHLLAVGSLRRFMPNLDRIHSVDSAAWDKSAAFGRVLVFEQAERKGVTFPVLKAYDRPDARVARNPMSRKLKREVWDGPISEHGWHKKTKGMATLAKFVTIHESKKYIRALQAYDPVPIREALAKDKDGSVRKSFFFMDDLDRILPGDSRVPDLAPSVGPDIQAAIERSLANAATRPRIEPVLSASSPELFDANIEKAAKPWLSCHFAVTPGQLRKFFADDPRGDVLISFAHFVRGRGRKDPLVPWEDLRKLKAAGRNVMLDSGAFTNFTKPGSVEFDQFREFLASPEVGEVFDSVVTFDDIRSRENTLKNYVTLLEDGHSPLFVDHLFYPTDEAVEEVWKSRDKVALSGFARTLPGQENMPGNPKERLVEMMLRGTEVETTTHLLAVSSMRRFLKYADRVDSVDSAAWIKAGVYSMFLHTEKAKLHGITVPVQKVYDRPGSGRQKPRFAPPAEQRKVARRIKQLRKKWGCSDYEAYVRYSIEQARIYVAGLNALDPKIVAEAYGSDSVSKALEEERGSGFAFVEAPWGTRDLGVSLAKKASRIALVSCGAKKADKAQEAEHPIDFRSYLPRQRADEELVKDWGTVCKLWAAFKQHGEETVGYSKNELIGLAVAIVRELVRRGPDAHVFDVEAMSGATEELWGAVLRHYKPPADAVSKELVGPRTDFDSMHPEELLAAHRHLHKVGQRVLISRGESDWTLDELQDAHARLVEALAKKGHGHPALPGALDGSSADLVGVGKASGDTMAACVYDYLAETYPDTVLDWVTRAEWRRTVVKLEDIDMARRPGGRDEKKVEAIAEAILSGADMDPVVLVNVHEGKLRIADGYHRTLGFEKAGRFEVEAWVGDVADANGPWDRAMHDAKLNKRAPETIDELELRLEKAWAADCKKAGLAEGEVRKGIAAVAPESLIIEAGPPNEWSGAVAGILGAERRKLITESWKSAPAKIRAYLQDVFERNMGQQDEQEKAAARYDHIDFKPPAGVKAELKRGLEWNSEGHGGSGLRPETVAWARRLARGGPISPEKAVKMRAWLARHESDKSGKGFEPGEDGYPSPGRVAWALWGGDPAVGWSSKLVEQMEAADRKEKQKAITSSAGGKLAPAQGEYVSHLHYIGNQPTVVLRFEKTAGGALDTWAFPRPAMETSVRSLAKAEELLLSGQAPLLDLDDVVAVEHRAPSPRGWLYAEGITPPGAYGAARTAPGVFHKLETGKVTVTRKSGRLHLLLEPTGGEPYRLALREVPCTGSHLGQPQLKTLLTAEFDSDHLGDLLSKAAPWDGPPMWVGKFSAPPPEVLDKRDGVVGTMKADATPTSNAVRTILKAEESGEKRLVYGIVLQPEVVDAQDDVISELEIETAAHAWLAGYNRENELGLMHKVFGDLGIELVQSYIAPVAFELGGKHVRKGTWIIVVRVVDDELWKLVKSGELTGFSIGGVATSRPT